MTESIDSVSWNVASFGFELRSSDVILLERAGTLFRPWRSRQALAPARSWFAAAVGQGAPGPHVGWRIQSNTTSKISYRETMTDALMLIEYQAVQTLLESPACPPTLHSALVTKNGRGVLILGPSEAGKSTLACALWQHGWSVLSDDGSLLDPVPGECQARGVPRRVSLRFPSRAHLGDHLWERVSSSPSCDETGEGLLFHPDEVDGRSRPVSTRLAAAIFLSRRGKTLAPATFERINPAQALLALLPYSNVLLRLGPSKAMSLLRPLAESVPAYDLGRGDLADMAESIDTLIERGS